MPAGLRALTRYEQQRPPGEVPLPISLPGWRGAGSASDRPERVPELPGAPGAEQAGVEAGAVGARGAMSSPLRGVGSSRGWAPTRGPSIRSRQFCEKPPELADGVAGLLSSPFLASDLEKAQGCETLRKLGEFLPVVRGQSEAARYDPLS